MHRAAKSRTTLVGRLATAVVVAALFGEPAVSAAARSILVLPLSPDDDRIEPVHEAIQTRARRASR